MPAIPWILGGLASLAAGIWAYDEIAGIDDDQYYQEVFWDSVDWRTGALIGLLGYWAFAKSTGKKVTVSKSKRGGGWISEGRKYYSASRF